METRLAVYALMEGYMKLESDQLIVLSFEGRTIQARFGPHPEVNGYPRLSIEFELIGKDLDLDSVEHLLDTIAGIFSVRKAGVRIIARSVRPAETPSFRPCVSPTVTVIAYANTTSAELAPLLEKAFTTWRSGIDLETLNRAFAWYEKACFETDLVSKFLDYWVALEVLSGLFRGDVPIEKCQECGRVLDSNRARLKAFLQDLGMTDEEREITGKNGLMNRRGKIFHRGKSELADKDIDDLKRILLTSIDRIIGSNRIGNRSVVANTMAPNA